MVETIKEITDEKLRFFDDEVKRLKICIKEINKNGLIHVYTIDSPLGKEEVLRRLNLELAFFEDKFRKREEELKLKV